MPDSKTTAWDRQRIQANRLLCGIAGVCAAIGGMAFQNGSLLCIPLFGMAGYAWRAAHD